MRKKRKHNRNQAIGRTRLRKALAKIPDEHRPSFGAARFMLPALHKTSVDRMVELLYIEPLAAKIEKKFESRIGDQERFPKELMEVNWVAVKEIQEDEDRAIIEFCNGQATSAKKSGR